jgi:hypothetical protein
LIETNNTKILKTKLLFRASRDGWLGEDFHNNCDNKGPTIVMIKTINGYTVGGFTT